MQRLEVVDDFFSDEEIKIVKNYLEEIFIEKEILFDDKLLKWGETLNTSNHRVEIYEVHPSIDGDVYNLIFEKMKKEFKMAPKAINFYFWKNGSHINWHNDAGHGGAATVYLNKKWERSWGGFFIYYLKHLEKLGIEMPKYNRCVFQSGRVEHATFPTSNESSIRKTIQVFFK